MNGTSRLGAAVSVAMTIGYAAYGEAMDLKAFDHPRRICTWAVAGPFDLSPANQDAEGAEPDPAEAIPHAGARTAGVLWRCFDDRQYCRNHDDYNDLFTFFMPARSNGPGGGTENKMALCGGYLWLPKEQRLRVHAGFNDTGAVFVNGARVLVQSRPGQAVRDGLAATCTMHKGWNTVVVQCSNVRRQWGFYLGFMDVEGQPLEGAEWSVHRPGSAQLNIATEAMPVAYREQPYVWLTVRNPGGDFPADNPSASPFRLLGQGGEPPYSWQIEGLPEGLQFDSAEGEFIGMAQAEGSYTLGVTLRDSTGRTAEHEFELVVASRPTERWFETDGRLGGKRHTAGEDCWGFENAQEQVELVRPLGYSWVMSTAYAHYELVEGAPILSDMLRGSLETKKRFAEAFRAAGMHFCMYMNFKEDIRRGNDYHANQEDKHAVIQRIFEEFGVRNAQGFYDNPDYWYFDGGHEDQIVERYPFRVLELDALFSLLKTLCPHAIVSVNSDSRGKDYECGDLDVVYVHGPAGFENEYWHFWPVDPGINPQGNNPKYLANHTWRMPLWDRGNGWGPFGDEEMWCRSIVSALADPGNLQSMTQYDLDFSPNDFQRPLLRRIANWLAPRKHAILQTWPYTIEEGAWGYDVVNLETGHVYLHILENPLGKTGQTGRVLEVGPVAFEVKHVRLVPQESALEWAQHGSQLKIGMQHVVRDSVDTIIEIIPSNPGAVARKRTDFARARN